MTKKNQYESSERSMARRSERRRREQQYRFVIFFLIALILLFSGLAYYFLKQQTNSKDILNSLPPVEQESNSTFAYEKDQSARNLKGMDRLDEQLNINKSATYHEPLEKNIDRSQDGQRFAELQIAKIGLKTIVYQGAGKGNYERMKAVTSFKNQQIGQVGNVIISGHSNWKDVNEGLGRLLITKDKDKPYDIGSIVAGQYLAGRELKIEDLLLEKGDTVKISNESGRFEYQVYDIRVVDANDAEQYLGYYDGKKDLTLYVCSEARVDTNLRLLLRARIMAE